MRLKTMPHEIEHMQNEKRRKARQRVRAEPRRAEREREREREEVRRVEVRFFQILWLLSTFSLDGHLNSTSMCSVTKRKTFRAVFSRKMSCESLSCAEFFKFFPSNAPRILCPLDDHGDILPPWGMLRPFFEKIVLWKSLVCRIFQIFSFQWTEDSVSSRRPWWHSATVRNASAFSFNASGWSPRALGPVCGLKNIRHRKKEKTFWRSMHIRVYWLCEHVRLVRDHGTIIFRYHVGVLFSPTGS